MSSSAAGPRVTRCRCARFGFGQPGAGRDVARDRDAEALWCSDFEGLKEEMPPPAAASAWISPSQPA